MLQRRLRVEKTKLTVGHYKFRCINLEWEARYDIEEDYWWLTSCNNVGPDLESYTLLRLARNAVGKYCEDVEKAAGAVQQQQPPPSPLVQAFILLASSIKELADAIRDRK